MMLGSPCSPCCGCSEEQSIAIYNTIRAWSASVTLDGTLPQWDAAARAQGSVKWSYAMPEPNLRDPPYNTLYVTGSTPPLGVKHDLAMVFVEQPVGGWSVKFLKQTDQILIEAIFSDRSNTGLTGAQDVSFRWSRPGDYGNCPVFLRFRLRVFNNVDIGLITSLPNEIQISTLSASRAGRPDLRYRAKVVQAPYYFISRMQGDFYSGISTGNPPDGTGLTAEAFFPTVFGLSTTPNVTVVSANKTSPLSSVAWQQNGVSLSGQPDSFSYAPPKRWRANTGGDASQWASAITQSGTEPWFDTVPVSLTQSPMKYTADASEQFSLSGITIDLSGE